MSQRLRRPFTIALPIITSLALAAGAVSAVAQDPAPLPTEAAPLNDVAVEQPARGLIVKLDDAADAQVSDLTDEVEAELPQDVTVANAQSGSDLGLLSLSEQVDAADLDDAIEQLEANPDVEWAVPNGVRMPSATASDIYYRQGYQWNLNGQWGVRANQAWDITTGSPNVRVAVIDTGILGSHPDLRGRYVAGRDFVDDEYRCVNRACTRIKYRRTFVSANDRNSWDGSPADPGDWRNGGTCAQMGASQSTWHGTHVAGIVAATRNNGGVVGIAPGVKVQPIRALGRCGGTDWDIAMGILWASGANVNKYDRRHGRIPLNRTPAKVINLSLGASANSIRQARQACRLYGSVARTARARGSILIAAAGNAGIDHRYNVPSSCPGFVSVAATMKTGARASFSNYGAGIDIAAPGGSGYGSAEDQILSTWNAGTTRPGTNAWGFMPGTSMAAPAVAAAAALGQSVGITNPDVLERVLKATARRSNCDTNGCGAGIVDAYGVLTARAPTSAPRISGSPRPGGTLSATTGSWRNRASVGLAWYRGSRVVGTGASYRPTRADIGRRLVVRATAANGNRNIFHQSSIVVKSKSRTVLVMPKRVKKSKRVRVRVKVTAPYVRATGVIRVFDGRKRIAVKKLKAKNRGSVRITLPKLKKGKHRIRVVYSGSGKVTASKRIKVVRSR
ncbi:S8 family serine peptidase [Aeromicrobium sp.]|uniref:S8 family serine peptidase n=1 Tax=Aeromicrobium sp. TaxID=1871063 RepID=UPI0028A9EB05|nr:S8 family serine peptidase [Aeromicrobium sp.]